MSEKEDSSDIVTILIVVLLACAIVIIGIGLAVLGG